MDAAGAPVDTTDAASTPLLGNRVDSFIWNGRTLRFERNLIKLRAFQADAGQPLRGNHNGGIIRFEVRETTHHRGRGDDRHGDRDGFALARNDDDGDRDGRDHDDDRDARRRPRRRQGQGPAVHHHRRRRPPRADPEPRGRPVWPGNSRRPVRRPEAGQRPPHRRGAAPQRRRHDAAGQPVLPAWPPRRRRGRREHPEDLRLRRPQQLRDGRGPENRNSLESGERRRLVRRDQPHHGGAEQRLGPADGAGEPRGGIQDDRVHAAVRRTAADPLAAGQHRRHAGRSAGAPVHAPRGALPRSAVLLEVRGRPGRDRVSHRPGARAPVRGRSVRRRVAADARRRVPDALQPVGEPAQPRVLGSAPRGPRRGQRGEIRCDRERDASVRDGVWRRDRHPDRTQWQPVRRVAEQRRDLRDPPRARVGRISQRVATSVRTRPCPPPLAKERSELRRGST